MLGKGNVSHGNANSIRAGIDYLVKDNWTLMVFFEKGKVASVELKLPYLGI